MARMRTFIAVDRAAGAKSRLTALEEAVARRPGRRVGSCPRQTRRLAGRVVAGGRGARHGQRDAQVRSRVLGPRPRRARFLMTAFRSTLMRVALVGLLAVAGFGLADDK